MPTIQSPSILTARKTAVGLMVVALMLATPTARADWIFAANESNDRTGQGPTPDLPPGDGTYGLLEGYSSRIGDAGTQPMRWLLRADCNSEGAMAMALNGVANDDAKDREIAANLVAFVLKTSPIQQGPAADPTNSAYGLLDWNARDSGAQVYYGDDNARATLGLLMATTVLNDDTWDPALIRCMLGNFRSTGPDGFRNPRIDSPEFNVHDWLPIPP